MSFTSFDIGKSMSDSFGKENTRRSDVGAIDEILMQANQSQDPDAINNAMSQILSRVSPERQQAALQVLQNKQKQLQANQQRERTSQANVQGGFNVNFDDQSPEIKKAQSESAFRAPKEDKMGIFEKQLLKDQAEQVSVSFKRVKQYGEINRTLDRADKLLDDNSVAGMLNPAAFDAISELNTMAPDLITTPLSKTTKAQIPRATMKHFLDTHSVGSRSEPIMAQKAKIQSIRRQITENEKLDRQIIDLASQYPQGIPTEKLNELFAVRKESMEEAIREQGGDPKTGKALSKESIKKMSKNEREQLVDGIMK